MIDTDSNNPAMEDREMKTERNIIDLNSESAMDKYLQSIGLYRKPVAKDGSCLFRAVAEKVYNTQAKHMDVRHECISYMKANSEHFKEFITGSFEHHLFELQNPKEWAGQVEITALSMLYKHDIVVYQEVNQPPQNVTDNGFKEQILLCFSNGNHYDCIYPKSFKEDAAFIQSLLYDHLYGAVFEECKKRDDCLKISAKYADLDTSTDGNGWADDKSKTGNGSEDTDATQQSSGLSWEVRRSLDPNIYRNVALEVWEQRKQDQSYADRMFAVKLQFRVGEECFIHLPGSGSPDEALKGRIDSFFQDSGLYNVWVPDCQDYFAVPSDCLRPILSVPDRISQISYTELPGYYKKSEDFQYPKTKKQKGKSSNREEDLKWKRLDLRTDGKGDTRVDGRFDSRGETQGYRRDGKKDRRGGPPGDRNREEKNEKYGEKKGRPVEKADRRKDSQRLLSPPAAVTKQENKVVYEEKERIAQNEREIPEPVVVASSVDYPTLKGQEKEKTAKRDESPAAFWHRMRSDVKPMAPGSDKLKTANQKSSMSQSSDKNIVLREGCTDTVERNQISRDVETDKDNELLLNAKLDTKTRSERVEPRNEESSTADNSVKDENHPDKIVSSITETVDNASKKKENDTGEFDDKQHRRDTSASTLDSNKIDMNPAVNRQANSWSDTEALDVDKHPMNSGFKASDTNGRSVPIPDKLASQHDQDTNENRNLEQKKDSQENASNSSVTHSQKAGPKATVLISNTGSLSVETKEVPSSYPRENMVSFPTGFEEPVASTFIDSTADYQNDLNSSYSPLTFMSSVSGISSSAIDGSNGSISLPSVEGDGFTDPTTSISVFQQEPNLEKPDQKNEQKIRILRKDNKDQFLYFNPPNENDAPSDTMDSRSDERSPKPEAKKPQGKKVSFGDVTEIAQVSNESFVPNSAQPVAPDYPQNTQGSINGITEPQEQLYYDEGAGFNPSIGIPQQVMPLMMQPFPPANEQIHIPQAYSVDPEGNDLPNHIPTLQYFFNLGLQYQFLSMQHQPPAFYNMQLPQMPTAALQMQPQQMHNQAAPQLPQQRFSQPLDPSAPQFQHEQQEDFMPVSSATSFQYDMMHPHALNQVRQPHSTQNPASQYEQPPRMRKGRGRGSNLGPAISMSRGYNIYNHMQPKQSHYRPSKRGFQLNAGHMGAPNQSFMYH